MKSLFFLMFFFQLTVAQADGGRFSFRLNDEPTTLDWNKAHTIVENYILMNIMEGLVELDNDLRVVPSLSDRWKVKKQGRVYEFHLREGVYWSDGVKLKAGDFVASWKRLLTASTAAPYAYLLFDIVGAQDYNEGKLSDFSKVGIRALNDQTLQVELKHKVSEWLFIPTFWVTFPMREDLLKLYPTDWTSPGKIVSLGPYLLSEYKPDLKIVLKKNPRYYGTAGNIDWVDAHVLRDDAMALKMYQAGKLDFISRLPSSEISKLSKLPEFKTFPVIRSVYLGFTENHPELDLSFRKAIAYAIDKKKIPDLLKGNQIAAGSFVPPGVSGNSTQIGLQYSPDSAKSELKKSKYSAGTTLKYLTLKNSHSLAVAHFIQSEIKKNLGIELKIESFDSKEFYATRKLRKHELFEGTWGADYPDADNILSIFTSDSGNNHLLWKNSQFDRLILEAREKSAGGDRERIYLAAQKILIETDAAIVPLFFDTQNVLVTPRTRGINISPVSYLFLKGVNLIQ